MTNYVFKRYEYKYVITFERYLAVKAELCKRLTPDAFGVNTVQSLYFDTENYRLIRSSLEKPVYKEKLRLRCYNLNDNDKNIYVEMKRKYDGIVYKRRIACKESQVKNILCGNLQQTQIEKELKYFWSFYGDLSPKMLILYDREAYFDKDGDLRVTFDRNVRYRTNDLNFYTSLDGESLLSEDSVIMELKSGTAFPLWICEILDRENIRKTSFSKYGTAYERECEKINKIRSTILCLNQFSAKEACRRSVSS